MGKFGVMLDNSRNAVMKVSEVKNFMDIIHSFGYNMIQLYTEDTYEIEGEPFFGYKRGRYTENELTEIVKHGEETGVEVIPCIQTLAHLNQIFIYPAYNKIHDVDDILLAEDPQTYALIEKMFKTIRKIFTSEYVNIGMDEAHLVGLGKYLDKHGYKKQRDILNDHLKKVIEIAKKYNFKPLMWSDMFFRLANHGEYYPENPELSDEVINSTPTEVGLIYWDYYHNDKNYYDKMMDAHKKFKNDVWFAGGAWTWCGFTPSNKFTLETMHPAMLSAREKGIDNVFITMWGDNGKECSFYSVLPSLFAIKKFYDGEENMDTIKSEFYKITGENFDAMMDIDLPNLVGGNTNSVNNPSKHMLYNDPFLGILDKTAKKNAEKEYKKIAKKMSVYAQNSKNYSYIFQSQAALSDVLSLKYNIGVRVRKAYKENNYEDLKKVSADYNKIIRKLKIFHKKFSYLWYKENKATGFEVQDIRLGGLMQRLGSCKNRLDDYIDGKISNIDELDEDVISYTADDEKITPCFNGWVNNVSSSRL